MKPALMRAAAALALAIGVVRARRSSVRSKGSDPLTSTGVRPPLESLVRTILKHPWLTLAALAIAVGIGGLIVVVSGVVSIKASSGHWRITAAILDLAKARSVNTHSLGIRPPFPLDDPALILRGATHYESGCYPCHGRPGVPVPPVMAVMTPPPPELSPRIQRWRPQDLFSIVKHGIKFTGMPAWPAPQRDDEVWAMVAFLQRMPQLHGAAYRALVFGGTAPASTAPRAVREICWRCHGVDGVGHGSGAFPSLAGQRATYLYGSLRAFSDRRRFSGIMATVAATLDDQMMREAAAYYERLPARPVGEANDASARARGESIAARGIPDRDIPACAECHGPARTPKNPAYPVIARQHARYLALQLELLQQRRRGGSGFENLMHIFVGRLGAEEIRDVTLYYSSLQQSAAP
jgi:cytochrome c553